MTPYDTYSITIHVRIVILAEISHKKRIKIPIIKQTVG